MNRWDEIRYINFWDATKIVKDNKDLFSEDTYLNYWEKNFKKVNDLVRIYKWTDDAIHAISEHRELFSVFNNLRSLIKTYLHSLVVNRSDSLI